MSIPRTSRIQFEVMVEFVTTGSLGPMENPLLPVGLAEKLRGRAIVFRNS